MKQIRKPDIGQAVTVTVDDEKISGVVVDALSVQFTFITFGEPDIRRVLFCFYNGEWE